MITLTFEYLKIPYSSVEVYDYAYLYENEAQTSFRIVLSKEYNDNAFKVINSHLSKGYILINGRNVWRRVKNKTKFSNYIMRNNEIIINPTIDDINKPILTSKYGTIIANKCIKWLVNNSSLLVKGSKSKLWREIDKKVGVLEEYITNPKQVYTDGEYNYLILGFRNGNVELKRLKGYRYRSIGGFKIYLNPEELVRKFESKELTAKYINKQEVSNNNEVCN